MIKRALGYKLPRYLSVRIVIVALALGCLTSWATLLSYSQNKRAASDTSRQASASNEVGTHGSGSTGATPTPTPTPQKLNGKIAYASYRGTNQYQILEVNPDGSNIAVLVTNNSVYGPFSPTWSRDGMKLLYGRLNPGVGRFIHLLDFTGGGTPVDTEIAQGGEPAWSPDGSKIAFGLDSGPIAIMNADGSNKTPLSINLYQLAHPTWSADGSKIAFTGSAQIFSVTITGTELTALTSASEASYRPDWSPDGSRIAFVRVVAPNNPEIYVVNADGTNEVRLTINPVTPCLSGDQVCVNTSVDDSPAWSPDGLKIAFTSRRAGEFSSDIFTMNPDGTNQVNVTNNSKVSDNPSWRPVATIPPNPNPTFSISGLVRDTSGNRLSGINVSISGTQFATQTDIYGAFTVDNLPASIDYSVVLSSPSYNTFTPQNLLIPQLSGNQKIQITASHAPTITAAAPLSRQQGTAASNSRIATVSDVDQAANTLNVTATPLTGTGVSINGISVDGSGNVTANVAASCTATSSTFTLTVTDNVTATATATLTVNVTANIAPTLSYSNQSVAFGGSLNVNPTGASDNGTVTYAVQAGHGLTTAPTVNAGGTVSITNAQPAGMHTITIRASDNCGATTDATFILYVTPALGNYANTSISLNGNTTVTPSAAPAGASFATATTTADFKGELEANPTTGVVRVTNAYPAGTYTVTVTAYDSLGATTTKTLTLTVTTPVPCDVFGPTAFAAAVNSGAGDTPVSVAVGDFNGDGKQDIVVVNNNGNTVSVLLRNAANTDFDPKVDFAVGASPFSVAVGDFNGDGKQDIVAANNNGNTVSVLLRNAANTGFDAKVDFAVGFGPISVAVGDFNGDGKQDIVVANQGGASVSVLLRNTANTGFNAKVDFAVAANPFSVAVGDFNGDGKQDIVAANQGGASVSVLLRNAANTGFDAKVDFAVGSAPSSVAVGDFNGDGKQDIVVANNNGNTVSVLLRNAANTGFNAKVDFAVGANPFSVAVGDFNGDGKQDIVAANQGGASVSVLLRNAANTGFDAKVDFAVGSAPSSVAVGDFNGDGKQDMVVANFNGNIVSILLRKCNIVPTITAAAPLSRERGTAASNSQIATVSDVDQAANTLSVAATPLTGTGVSINGISIDGSGNLTANVAASCTATNSTFTLTVTDNATATGTATLTVNVTSNTAPTLSYANQSVAVGGSLNVTPTAASDNGTVTYSVQPGHGLTTAPTVNSGGALSISNAQPPGTHTITIRATDNCGATTDATFTLDVGPPIQLILDTSGPALDQVAALDSVLFLRDPFPVVHGTDLFNQGTDRNTRVMIFLINLQLAQGETSSAVVINLIDINSQVYDVAAENVRPIPGSDFTQVIFRLPDNVLEGTCTIRVKAHGQVSNAGTIRIRI